MDEVDQWNGIGMDWDQGALRHVKKICSISSTTRCSETKPADKNEKTAKKKKLRKPGCHMKLGTCRHHLHLSLTRQGHTISNKLEHAILACVCTHFLLVCFPCRYPYVSTRDCRG